MINIILLCAVCNNINIKINVEIHIKVVFLKLSQIHNFPYIWRWLSKKWRLLAQQKPLEAR